MFNTRWVEYFCTFVWIISDAYVHQNKDCNVVLIFRAGGFGLERPNKENEK